MEAELKRLRAENARLKAELAEVQELYIMRSEIGEKRRKNPCCLCEMNEPPLRSKN